MTRTSERSVTTREGDASEARADRSARHELDAVGALAEPTRRALYEYVVAERRWVCRDEAAQALGLRRGITVHHLDRLADDGLLEIDHQRRTGRTGPGAGRPAKVYRRAQVEVDVSLPPRRYDLAGRLLTEAADRSRVEGTPIALAIDEAARAEGDRIAEAGRRRLDHDADDAARRDVLFDVLRERGFEPDTRDDGVTVLHNCPFHQLSEEHPELICGMNLGLLGAVVDGLGATDLDPRLEPQPGECCVRFHPTNRVDDATIDGTGDPAPS
jgi:predicted ArsR family transcriptional regulator